MADGREQYEFEILRIQLQGETISDLKAALCMAAGVADYTQLAEDPQRLSDAWEQVRKSDPGVIERFETYLLHDDPD